MTRWKCRPSGRSCSRACLRACQTTSSEPPREPAPVPAWRAASGDPLVLDNYPVPADSGAFIAFKLEGQIVIGNSGCNSLTGSYAEDGVALTFGPIATTRMLCPDDQMLVETELLGVLEETHAVWREGTNLTLMGDGNRVLARFVQTDWD